MRCPWCTFEGSPRRLHAHLAEAHPEGIRFEERVGRSFYALTCPVCGAGYEHQIKPRGRDPGFVEEYQGQIRLVAFDMLVNHLMAEHGEGVAQEPAEAGSGEEGAPAAAGPLAAGPAGGPEWLVRARQEAAEREQGRGAPGQER